MDLTRDASNRNAAARELLWRVNIFVVIAGAAALTWAALAHASIMNADPASVPNAVGVRLSFSSIVNNWVANSNARETQQGTPQNDQFQGVGGDTLVGGAGDDTYTLWDSGNIVIEKPDDGVDTIESHVGGIFILPDNVENLLLKSGDPSFAVGNAQDNILVAGTAAATLDGGGGNDVLIAGSGADTFQIRAGNGSDAIIGFKPKIDTIRLSGYKIYSFDQVKGHARQLGPDTVFTLGNERLVLRDILLSSLSASNFGLPIDLSAMRLSFRDEFATLKLRGAGGVWFPNYGLGGTADRGLPGEQQIYVDRTYAGKTNKPLGIDPFPVSPGGIVSITAAPVAPAHRAALGGALYTSGLLTSKDAFSQQYGYFEIRAALPHGMGFLPQFWLMPEAGGWPPEIDIMESLGKEPAKIYMTTHNLNGKVDGNWTYVDHPEAMHTYGLNWTKSFLTWYVDGAEVARQRTADNMHQEFFVILNLAMGNDWAGHTNEKTGIGSFDIDYLRVYRNSDTVSATINARKTYYKN